MAEQPALPVMPAAEEPGEQRRPPTPLAQQRLARAVRTQIELIPQSLDDRLAADHPARAIWALLERLDLTAFYAAIRVALAGPGRSASDPRVLLGLWLLATVEGIGSARNSRSHRTRSVCLAPPLFARWPAGRIIEPLPRQVNRSRGATDWT